MSAFDTLEVERVFGTSTLDLGCTFLDTVDMYGPFTNERLVGRATGDRYADMGTVNH